MVHTTSPFTSTPVKQDRMNTTRKIHSGDFFSPNM